MSESGESEKIDQIVGFLQGLWGKGPKLAIVLGSGLGDFVESVSWKDSVSYADIPHMLPSTSPSHKGQIFLGDYQGRPSLCVSGRLHGYEGYSPNEVVRLLRAIRTWGCSNFILTNASGSTHIGLPAGSLVLLKDHINFTGMNPLVGTELFRGERFPDMSNPYSQQWRRRVLEATRASNFSGEVTEAVYMGVLGPSFETASEIEAFHKMGADVVGMSTVWEVIALHQMGANILGISCVANFGTGVADHPLTGEEVFEEMKKSSTRICRLIEISSDQCS